MNIRSFPIVYDPTQISVSGRLVSSPRANSTPAWIIFACGKNL